MNTELNPKINNRLLFIDFYANYHGKIGRSDLVSRFGISDAAASKDISEYIRLVPDNLTYNFKTKSHFASQSFEPLFDHSVQQVLQILSEGFVSSEERIKKPLLVSEHTLDLSKPKLNVISQISRAISQKKIMNVTYWSLTSARTERQLAPFAIINSGLRWHVRAFCRRANEFRDFVLTRTEKAQLTDEDRLEYESEEFDEMWNRKISIELVPHPFNIEYPEPIMMDYGMVDGCLKMEVRFAVAGYLFRHWNIDCSPDNSEHSRNFQLWLKNGNEIEGIETLVMAPGAEKWKSLCL